MKKDLVKKLKFYIWGSHGIIILVSAVVLWILFYSLFSEPTVLKDLARVLIDKTASATEITWIMFWIAVPAVALMQLAGGLMATSCLGEKKEKEAKKASTKTSKKKSKKK